MKWKLKNIKKMKLEKKNLIRNFRGINTIKCIKK